MALILKRASASHPSGEWSCDDYDVLADGVVVGCIMKAPPRPQTLRGSGLWPLAPSGSHADARLRADAQGRNGDVREELAAVPSTGLAV
jgi:hypothetical protein